MSQQKKRKKEKDGPITLMAEHVRRMMIGNISDQYHGSSWGNIVLLMVALVVVYLIQKLTGR